MSPRPRAEDALPVPTELRESGADVIFLHRELLAERRASGDWKQELEGRMRQVERAVGAMAKASESSAASLAKDSKEILKRIGQDDDEGSYGLTGKVGGLERAMGTSPDTDGKGGSGLRGEVASLGKRIQPFERIRDALKTLWPVLVLIAALLAWAWAPTFQAIIAPGFKP